jgi:hypothetical protein
MPDQPRPARAQVDPAEIGGFAGKAVDQGRAPAQLRLGGAQLPIETELIGDQRASGEVVTAADQRDAAIVPGGVEQAARVAQILQGVARILFQPQRRILVDAVSKQCGAGDVGFTRLTGRAAAEQNDHSRPACAHQRGGARDARGKIGVEASAGRMLAEHEQTIAMRRQTGRASCGADDTGEIAEIDHTGAERADGTGDQGGVQQVGIAPQTATVIETAQSYTSLEWWAG